MATRYLAGLVALLTATAAAAHAQAPPPIKVTLHPAAAPAARYRLLPELIDQKPGDGAAVYKRVAMKLDKQLRGDVDAQVTEWTDMPLDDLPRDEVRRFLAQYREGLRLLDDAARREYCDWGIADRLRKAGIGANLPELQAMREATRFLVLRVRLEMAEGRWDDAVRSFQTGYALARDVGQTPTLISYLVGVAIASLMNQQLDEFIRHADAPDLYGALADLPRPFLSMRKPLQGERLAIYGTFPGVAEVLRNPRAAPLTSVQLKTFVDTISGLMVSPVPVPVLRAYFGLRIQQRHDAAKRALVAQGRPRSSVEQMPHVEVALLHSLAQYDRLFDDLIRCQNRPYWEAYPLLREELRRQRQMKDTADGPAVPLAQLLLPALDKVVAAGARLERRLAALTCLEAIRLYAHSHGGKLPPTLADVKDVPVPFDPVTGKPFQYRVRGATATLAGPPPEGEKPNLGNALTYEITMRR